MYKTIKRNPHFSIDKLLEMLKMKMPNIIKSRKTLEEKLFDNVKSLDDLKTGKFDVWDAAYIIGGVKDMKELGYYRRKLEAINKICVAEYNENKDYFHSSEERKKAYIISSYLMEDVDQKFDSSSSFDPANLKKVTDSFFENQSTGARYDCLGAQAFIGYPLIKNGYTPKLLIAKDHILMSLNIEGNDLFVETTSSNGFDMPIDKSTFEEFEFENIVPTLLAQRGIYKQKDGENSEAIKDYSKAIELFPHKKFYTLRAIAKIDSANIMKNKFYLKGALNDSDKALATDSQYSDAYDVKAYASFKMNNHKSALINSTRSIAINPSSDEPYFIRGLSLLEIAKSEKNKKENNGLRKRYSDKAINDFSKFIDMNPKDPAGFYQRALAKHVKRDYAGAKNDLNKAQELGMTKKIKSRKALVSIMQKDYLDAWKNFTSRTPNTKTIKDSKKKTPKIEIDDEDIQWGEFQ